MISLPNVTLSIIPAADLAGVTEHKALILGQMLAGGTATSGELIQDHPDDGSENALFGARAHISGVVRNFKRSNKLTQMDILPLSDAAGQKGTCVITLSGTATGSGALKFYIGSKKDHAFTLYGVTGDTADDLGASLVALTDADTKAPFTGANLTGAVTYTAENAGTLSNSWGLAYEGSIPGITVTLTPWSGGGTDPSLTGVLDVITKIRYQTIVWPSSWDITVLADVLDERFNMTNAVMDGVGIFVGNKTLADLKAEVATLNSPSICFCGQATNTSATFNGGASLEMNDCLAAQIAAVRCLRLTQDAPLASINSTVAAKDQYGGIGISTLPYHNTALNYAPIPNAVHEFVDEDNVELVRSGVSTFGANRAYNGTILGEMVTTRLTDVAGNPDTSLLFLETRDASSIVREFFFENLKKRYAQSRLTGGDLVSRKDIANRAGIRAFCNQLYDELAEEAILEKGNAAKKDYNENLYIDIDYAAGAITIDQAPLLVTQVRSFTGTIQINFRD